MAIVGIDLGTTFSVICIIRSDGTPDVIVNAEGGRTTPSVVAITRSGEIVVGANALKLATTDPSLVVMSVKRMMGHREDIILGDRTYTPEQISSMIIRKMIDDASVKIGERIERAVVTVPAYFDDAQRTATKNAGDIADIEIVRIINEPTAAALAYGMDRREDLRTVCVYDLGGGTFDISILDIGGGLCEVKATAGDTKLGGCDFDNDIRNWMLEGFLKQTGIDLSSDTIAMARLREAAEAAKIVLSSSSEAQIDIPYITMKDGQPIHLSTMLHLSKFTEMMRPWIRKTIELVDRALNDAGKRKDEIAEILLVGGSTRIQCVRDAIEDHFGRSPNQNLHPDEVVAIGAAYNAAIIEGIIKDVVLADITPLTLAVETRGGVAASMIPRNTTIPATRHEMYSTAEDNQESVEVHITQGERAFSAENRTLGRLKLDILPAPAGIPKIEVTFDIDVNGILSVFAKDMATGIEESVTLQGSSDLSEEDLKKIVSDAKAHAEEDRARRDLVEARQRGEYLMKRASQLLSDNEQRLSQYVTRVASQTPEDEEPEDIIQDVVDAIETVQKNLNVDNPQVIIQSVVALNDAMMEIGKALYAETGKEKSHVHTDRRQEDQH